MNHPTRISISFSFSWVIGVFFYFLGFKLELFLIWSDQKNVWFLNTPIQITRKPNKPNQPENRLGCPTLRNSLKM